MPETTTFSRPTPYGVSILRFDRAGSRIRVTRRDPVDGSEYSEVMPVARAREIAEQAERDMDEMIRAAKRDGRGSHTGWTDGGFGAETLRTENDR